MLCTRVSIDFCFERLPQINWWEPWQDLAELIEKRVEPNLKTEVIWWRVVPATALKAENLVLNGSIELCQKMRLPEAAASLFSRTSLPTLVATSVHPVQIELEFSLEKPMKITRPSSSSSDDAIQKIVTQLRRVEK